MKKVLLFVLVVIGNFCVSAQSTNVAKSDASQSVFDISVVGIDNYPPITLVSDTIKNDGVLQLTMEEGFEETLLQVFDDNGKLLQVQVLVGAKAQVNFTDYGRGLYYVSLVKGKKALKVFQVAKM